MLGNTFILINARYLTCKIKHISYSIHLSICRWVPPTTKKRFILVLAYIEHNFLSQMNIYCTQIYQGSISSMFYVQLLRT